jgi:hypothetical protein
VRETADEKEAREAVFVAEALQSCCNYCERRYERGVCEVVVGYCICFVLLLFLYCIVVENTASLLASHSNGNCRWRCN